MVVQNWIEMEPCKHENFKVVANVGRVLTDDKEPPSYWSVDLRLNCTDCNQEFQWWGLPCGFSPYQPTVSIDGKELRISVMPEGQEIPRGLPGFKVTHTTYPEVEPTKQ